MAEQVRRKHVDRCNLTKVNSLIMMEGMMVRVGADHIPFGKVKAAGRQPFASVETDIGFGLFDEADDDRIDSDGNPLENMDDDEFDDTADARDED